MTRPLAGRRGRPLTLVVPTAFVRIGPRGAAACGAPGTQTTRRCRAASRRLAGQ